MSGNGCELVVSRVKPNCPPLLWHHHKQFFNRRLYIVLNLHHSWSVLTLSNPITTTWKQGRQIMHVVQSNQILSRKIQDLYGWYCAQQKAGRWPALTSFLPELLPAGVLQNIGRVDVELDPFRIYYRAVGSIICYGIGTEMSRKYLDELSLPQAADLARWYKVALTAPGPLFVSGLQTVFGHEFEYEGCALPLGHRNDDPRAFLIAEDYRPESIWQEALRHRIYGDLELAD